MRESQIEDMRRRAFGVLRLRRTPRSAFDLQALDERALAEIRKHRSPAFDQIVSRLSVAADHSVLWLATASGLAVFGGRPGRRAALRGLIALGATSALATGVGKQLFVRHRPSRHADALRIRRRSPMSSSMPSGHAASAAAFAVAASSELPAMAAPLGALATAVAFSRVYDDVHYPADVAVGAAIGIGVAIGTTKVWPLTADSAASARPILTTAEARSGVGPRGSGLTIVANPSAQSGRGDDLTGAIREALPEAELVVVDSPEALEAALRGAATRSASLGIVGGDGSVNAAVAVALEHDTALAVFPGGTLNHFARDLGVRSVDHTISAIRDGRLVAVDVGTMDGRPFVNTASFGSYSKLVEAREQLENSIGKWPALVVALTRVLFRCEPFDVAIDGRAHRIWMIFIGNCAYDPPGFAPAARARLDDGVFDVRIVDGSTPWSRVRLMTAILVGTLARSKVYRRQLVSSMTFNTPSQADKLAVDGEVFEGSREFTIDKSPTRLRVYAPE